MKHGTGRVFIVQLTPPSQGSLLMRPREVLVNALTPGASAIRYRREWIVGGVEVTQEWMAGRIGFRGAEGVVDVWDDVAMDFVDVSVPSGLTTQFVIDLLTLRLAIQPRGAIKLEGVLGAIQTLLRGWRLSVPGKETTYRQWLASVVRVTDIKMSVRKPNPHWRDTPDLKTLVEETEAEAIRVEMESEDGLDTDAPFIAQSMEHITVGGYGEATLVGHRLTPGGGTQTSVYQTTLGTEESPESAPTDENGEVSRRELFQALARSIAG